MSRGLDANVDLTAHAKCIKDAGFSFVCRYYKRTASSLSRAEAMALSAAGLNVVVVVEIGSPTTAGYFSRAKGVEHGTFAYRKARDTIRQPPGSAIYFAADYDVSQADASGPVKAYFEGVLQGFNAESGDDPAYSIGVYSNGLACAYLLRHTAVTYAWLSMSTGFRGSRTFKGWNLHQLVGDRICGVSVDTDVSNGHGGGFRVA